MSRFYPIGFSAKIAPGATVSVRAPAMRAGMIDRFVVATLKNDSDIFFLDMAWGSEASLEYRPGWQNDYKNPQRIYVFPSIPVRVFGPDRSNPEPLAMRYNLPPHLRMVQKDAQIRLTFQNRGLEEYSLFATVLLEIVEN